MILEIAIASSVAVVVGSIAAWRRGRPTKVVAARPDVPRSLRVGDAILYDGTELWLAGQVALSDGAFSLELFRTPGNPVCEWIAATGSSGNDILLLRPSLPLNDAGAADAIRIDDALYRRVRRGRAAVEARGSELPPTTSSASYACFEGPGGHRGVVVEFDPSHRLALTGLRAEPSRIDVLPGGDVPAQS